MKSSSPPAVMRPDQLLIWSADTQEALDTSTRSLAEYLARPDCGPLQDVAYTLQTGRPARPYRRMLVSRDPQDAARILSAPSKQILAHHFQGGPRAPVFMFPGLGVHYTNMALGLFQSQPVFREELELCLDLLASTMGSDFRSILYPPSGNGDAASASASDSAGLANIFGAKAPGSGEASAPFNQTRYNQPIVFAVEYALARLWMDWGIRPAAMIGYSVGEYVAACLAGVLELPDALLLVAHRARLINELPGGAMLAVPLSEEKLLPLLGGEICLAAISGPSLCIAAGPTPAIAALETALTGKRVFCRRLQASHAFHSRMMKPVEGKFLDLLRRVPLRPPRIPYVSNVTGTWITDAQAVDPNYWMRHTCEAVRFHQGVRELSGGMDKVLLEVGPGQSLTGLVQFHPGIRNNPNHAVVPSLRNAYDTVTDDAFLMGAVGKLWLHGLEPAWDDVHGGKRAIEERVLACG